MLPAPWFVDKRMTAPTGEHMLKVQSRFSPDGASRTVCTVTWRTINDEGAAYEHARVIARVPELLEVCNEAMVYLGLSAAALRLNGAISAADNIEQATIKMKQKLERKK